MLRKIMGWFLEQSQCQIRAVGRLKPLKRKPVIYLFFWVAWKKFIFSCFEFENAIMLFLSLCFAGPMKGNLRPSAPRCEFQIPGTRIQDSLSVELGCRIPIVSGILNSGFGYTTCKHIFQILHSKSKNFPDLSGIRITLLYMLLIRCTQFQSSNVN